MGEEEKKSTRVDLKDHAFVRFPKTVVEFYDNYVEENHKGEFKQGRHYIRDFMTKKMEDLKKETQQGVNTND